MAETSRSFRHEDYTVGWICALPETELVVARAMLDEEHPILSAADNKDTNVYVLGRIGSHNVVIACLPDQITGKVSAATVAKDMLRSFTAIRFGLMVGVGGAAPFPEDHDLPGTASEDSEEEDNEVAVERDIRLGDVVVSLQTKTTDAVVQYDFGKSLQGGEFIQNGRLNIPANILLSAVGNLKSKHIQKGTDAISGYLSSMVSANPRLAGKFEYQGVKRDRLFKKNVTHQADKKSCKACCGVADVNLVRRRQRVDTSPVLHYGTIGSADQVMKDPVLRNKWAQEKNIICFEMEAAGLMNTFPCVVIRGISDYADSHKNWMWQPYAAATAAAYTKELLHVIPGQAVTAIDPIISELAANTDKMIQHHTADTDRMMQHQTANTDKAIKHQEQWRRSDKEEECLQSFRTIKNTSNNYEHQKNLNLPRAEKTCLWCLQNPIFLNWKDRLTSRLLWVTADPGCGKSVLSKALIDESLLGQQENDIVVCYFFFKDTSPERRSPAYALSALLHQLFNSKKGAKLIRHALPGYIANKKNLATNIDLLWSIIREVAKDPECPRIIFLLDALDECESKSQLDLIWKLKGFEEMRITNTETMRNVQFLVTSRPYWDIEKEFQELISKMPNIRLQAEETSDVLRSEIKHVIEARLNQLDRRKIIASAKAYDLLRKSISEIVNRTYLWVHLVFQEIGKEPRLDVKTVENLILPPSVDEAYEAILRKTKKPEDAKRLLHIVVGAKRPLSLRETAIALYITEEKHCHEDLELQEDEQFMDTIRDLCGLFVSIVDEKVFLIHQTAKEFLVNHSHINNLTPMSWKGSLAPETSNLILAKCCLSYLLFGEFRQLLSPEEKSMKVNGGPYQRGISIGKYLMYNAARKALPIYISLFPERSSFLDYSASTWYEHLREAGPIDSSPLVKMCFDLRTVDFLFFRLWFPFYDHYSEVYQKQPSWKNLVLFVACLGLNNLMVALPMDKMEIDIKDHRGTTGLMWAAKKNHKAMVELLLEKGADVNIQGGPYSNALQAACETGYEAIVKLLLEKGADVNARGGFYDNALQAACQQQGYEAVVRLLLENGADVNTQGDYHGTALQAACKGGNEAVVRLLLENGADVNAQGGYVGTALRAACAEGNKAVVRLLLENGADVNVQCGFYGTALQAACGEGYEAVVKLLLEKGADVNAQGGFYGNALQGACKGGYEAVVRLLLQTGKVNIDSRDNACRTILSHVTKYSTATVVEILLQTYRADPNSKDSNNRTPLSWAAEHGNIPVIELLLQVKNIEVDSRDVNGRTPLSWAAAGYKNAMAVDLLLKTDRVEVDSRDVNGRTPLSWAAEFNRSATVQLLLETGKADIESRDIYGQTPLLCAAKHGSLETVEALLEIGKAQVDLRDVHGRSALSWAAEYGHTYAVESLLRSEVNADLEDTCGRTPLSWAAAYGNLQIVKLLLKSSKKTPKLKNKKCQRASLRAIKNMRSKKLPLKTLVRLKGPRLTLSSTTSAAVNKERWAMVRELAYCMHNQAIDEDEDEDEEDDEDEDDEDEDDEDEDDEDEDEDEEW